MSAAPGYQNGRRSAAALRRRRILLRTLAVLPVLVVAGLLLVHFAATDPRTTSDDAQGRQPPAAAAPASLDDRIAAIIADAGDCRVAVAVADVSGDVVETYGDDSRFFAASTAKIITAAAYYHLVEGGQLRLDEQLGDFDAAFQLQAMINDSNNDAWLLLMQRIGYPELIDYAASIGITYDPEENLLTATDLAVVLRGLDNGVLLDAEDTAQLLGFMQDTNNEDLIPAASRADITVHHKYGEVEGNLHDAALLSDGTATFALVVLTEDPRDPATDDVDQIQLIRSVTQAVEDTLLPTGR
ncbi:hypothetical protein AC792_00095 [Arthrobacter sp. RIT-PI-e]|uniref:serine hydrolase n=1 Tax=Arthrobacter sp. RIT-PI-e TaxID=1681197 RepID=UPI000675FB90|nr:serine hydrolase [Arthrobacter sp. RIT-PI-e]KNC20545.1 hypothetical protein AC792_00095 [Arthrobacter sp. RIT-PI-e]